MSSMRIFFLVDWGEGHVMCMLCRVNFRIFGFSMSTNWIWFGKRILRKEFFINFQLCVWKCVIRAKKMKKSLNKVRIMLFVHMNIKIGNFKLLSNMQTCLDDKMFKIKIWLENVWKKFKLHKKFGFYGYTFFWFKNAYSTLILEFFCQSKYSFYSLKIKKNYFPYTLAYSCWPHFFII
jgi:hypothetical protein